MISQTDKANLFRLKELRNHKLKKATINIEKAKRALKEALAEESHIKESLKVYQVERKQKHEELFLDLKEQESITIETLNSHQFKNQSLINGEEEIKLEIIAIDQVLEKKEGGLKECQQTLRALNKKIASLKEVQRQFFRA